MISGENSKKKNDICSASSTQHQKAKYLKSILYNLFDIAHQVGLQNTLEEDKQFNYSERKRTFGYMGSVDFKFKKTKERREKRPKAEITRLENSRKTIGEFEFLFNFNFTFKILFINFYR